MYPNQRLYTLDYLRAMVAVGVVAYHFTQWNFGLPKADAFFGRIAIYGVEIFYLLSGLTLFHVYEHKMQPLKAGMIRFARRRLFRLYPLLWLATAFSIFLDGQKPTLLGLLLNFTGLFGFVAPALYYTSGAWSIGNELVFYSVLPLFFICLRRFQFLFWALGGIIAVVFIYYAFLVLQPDTPLYAQWAHYVNPFNHLFFFYAGFAMGVLFKHYYFTSKELGVLLALSTAFFFLCPINYTSVSEIVTDSTLR